MATRILLALWSENGFGGMTMAEYIEREKVIHEIDTWLDSVGTVLVGKGLSYYGELLGCVEDVPAADVAPVRRGQWGLYEDTHEHLVKYVCPFCYNYVGFRHDPGEDTVRGNYIYCHSCGAKLGDDEQ